MEQVKKPGVEITQVIAGTTPTVSSPNLIPCVVGPAFEVVELLNADGTPNQDAKLVNSQGNAIPYTQLPLSVAYESFPTPHADATQMQVKADEVNVGLFSGGAFKQLNVRPSSAFLAFANYATRAGIFFTKVDTSNFNLKLNIALNQRSADDVTSDILIDISAANIDVAVSLLASRLSGIADVAKINRNGVDGIRIVSKLYGAASSVTLRCKSAGVQADHSAIGLDNNTSYRFVGAGFSAQPNGTSTVSPFIVFNTESAISGAVLTSGTSDIDLAESSIGGAWIKEDGTESDSIGLPVTFGSTGTIKIKPATPTSDGDLFYTTSLGFGNNVTGVQIVQVEEARFKLGVVDSLRSIYDAVGNPTNQKYLEYNVGQLTSSNPFAPKNAYFIAQNLTAENTTSTYGAVSGVIDLDGWTAAQNADVDLTTSYPLSGVEGLVLSISAFNDGQLLSEESITMVGTFDTAQDLVDFLQGSITSPDIEFVLDGNNADMIHVRTVSTGAVMSITVSGTFLQNLEHDGVLLTGDEIITGDGADELHTEIVGESLQFNFNGASLSTDFEVTAANQSLTQFVSKVNEVVGTNVCALSTVDGDRVITFTTYLKGQGGSVVIRSGTLATLLGLSSTESFGAGRPDPDLLIGTSSVVLGAEIQRSPLNGKPIRGNSAVSTVFLEYRALRLDLSPIANQPGLIKVSSISDLNAVYGPVSTRNPLALGIYFALLNAGDGVEISAIGVSDISEAEPNGTALAYLEAAEFLRSHEVYAISVLSQSEQVIEIFDKHAKDMSNPALRAERVFISAPKNPVRKNSTVVLSGETAESTGVVDQVDLNDTPEAALGGYGVDTSDIIPFQLQDGKQLYLSILIGDLFRNYSVISVDGSRVTIRRSFTTSQNADGFYSTESLPTDFSSATFSLQLRGTSLTIAGSNKLDKTEYAKTIRDKAQQYANRRQLRLYPEQVQSVLGGVSVVVPSFYFACALAGACATVPPQEPFTRRKLVGFTNVIGPALENSQYDIISAGNSVIEVESTGETPALRIQATTDVSSIESREWSITRSVDYFSKILRNALRRRVGLFNITQAYIDDLSTLLDSACNSSVSAGLFRSASVAKLEQDKTQPDTLLVSITVEVLYPANYIQLSIVI